MKAFLRDILIMFSIAVFLLLMVLLLTERSEFFKSAGQTPVLPIIFLLIFLIITGVVHAGIRRNADIQGLYTLAAVALKFLLPGIIAIVWFALLKNNSYADVVLFFIVYLSFSITIVLLIVRNLNNHT